MRNTIVETMFSKQTILMHSATKIFTRRACEIQNCHVHHANILICFWIKPIANAIRDNEPAESIQGGEMVANKRSKKYQPDAKYKKEMKIQQ